MAGAKVGGVPDNLAVCSIVEVEMSQPLLPISVPDDGAVLIVAWLCGEPIGMLLRPAGDLRSPTNVANAINDELAEGLRETAVAHGIDGSVLPLTADGLQHANCPVRARQDWAAGSEDAFSVVLSTRDRPDSLLRCLDSLAESTFQRFEIVVVDNAPRTDATARLCHEFAHRHPDAEIRYVREDRPGLSRARNTGIAAAGHDLLAFVDDDERVDKNWLTALSAEFSADPSLGCVSGVVLPAELKTTAQVGFEQFGGHSKGRGFQRVLFDSHYLAERQSPMYPLPPFGVGANMAFRRSALREIGGFDTALGAGTATHASEDTLAFTEVLLAGWRMVYAPAAMTWHYHRSDDVALLAQLTGYGAGLGAYYAALVTRDPRRILALLRLAPRALRDLVHPKSARNATLGELPPSVARANMRKLATGPFIYWRERWATRRPER